MKSDNMQSEADEMERRNWTFHPYFNLFLPEGNILQVSSIVLSSFGTDLVKDSYLLPTPNFYIASGLGNRHLVFICIR